MENKVNYDEISQVYDDIRKADVDLINSFLREINFDHAVKVLDIGCGTGNHTDLVQKLTQARVYGLDPSEGMLSKATQKFARRFQRVEQELQKRGKKLEQSTLEEMDELWDEGKRTERSLKPT